MSLCGILVILINICIISFVVCDVSIIIIMVISMILKPGQLVTGLFTRPMGSGERAGLMFPYHKSNANLIFLTVIKLNKETVSKSEKE